MFPAGDLDLGSLPIRLDETQAFDHGQRAIARREALASASASSSGDIRQAQHTADSSMLPGNKGAKFYGVRRGHHVGIYYAGKDAQREVAGYSGSQTQWFRTAEEVKDFMNHTPDRCTYEACKETCKQDAAENEQKHLLSNTPPQKWCDCCNSTIPAIGLLCDDCFTDRAKYVENIAQRYGLNAEQREALDRVATGLNVFITGCAGSGKSRTTLAIVQYLRGIGLAVEVVAPTSLPATTIGGRTLRSHLRSYIGSHTDMESLSTDDLMDAAKKIAVETAIPATDVLVIDEGSMLDSTTITRLSITMSAAAERWNTQNASRPFGGAQIVFSADFHQLPPLDPSGRCFWCGQVTHTVVGEDNKKFCTTHGYYDLEKSFAFSSPIWNACKFEAVELVVSHRHGQDWDFFSSLDSFRLAGYLSPEQRFKLQSGQSTANNSDAASVTFPEDEAVTLYSKRQDADKRNKAMISQLSESDPKRSYKAIDSFLWYPDRHSGLQGARARVQDSLVALKDHELDRVVELKEDMLVVLMTDIDERRGLVSGAVGIINGFIPIDDDSMPRVEEDAAAGAVPGESLHGPYRYFKEAQIKQFCDALPPSSRYWPSVSFKTGRDHVVFATCLIQELGHTKPYSLLARTQIPLLPAYGLTIQRSQGLTLDKVSIDLANCMEDGRAYVALNRARDRSSIIVKTLPEEAHIQPEVREFYKRLAISRGEKIPSLYIEPGTSGEISSEDGDDAGDVHTECGSDWVSDDGRDGDGDVEMMDDDADAEVEEVADGMEGLQLGHSEGSRKRLKMSH